MRSTMFRNLTFFVCGAFIIFAFCAQPAQGTPLTLKLTCILAGPTAADVSCDPLSDYGTVTLSDPNLNGDIQLTVDLTGVAGKFRDLMLNFQYNAGGITMISSTDGQALLSPDGFSLTPDGFTLDPYDGKFDIGGIDQSQHWNSTTALYQTWLSSVDGNLTTSMFDVKDSFLRLNVAMHIQDLDTNGGSLKVGGNWGDGGTPPQEIPEPATAALLGAGLIALAWTLRRRRAS